MPADPKGGNGIIEKKRGSQEILTKNLYGIYAMRVALNENAQRGGCKLKKLEPLGGVSFENYKTPFLRKNGRANKAPNRHREKKVEFREPPGRGGEGGGQGEV